ncbi:MAG: DUF2807 domain-containing protein [Thermomicrobiales bacterium]
MRISAALLLVSILMLGSGLFLHPSGAQEQGETQAFELGDFDEINLRGAGRVTITLGDESRVEITAPQSVSSLFSVRVEDGELIGGFGASVAFDLLTAGDIEYAITTPSLTSLDLQGPMQATLDGLTVEEFDLELSLAAQATVSNLNISRLEADLETASTATLSGIATTQDIELSSGATYDAAELDSVDVAVDLATASTATVRASGTVSGAVRSASTLNYLTEGATVTAESRSGGSIVELPFVPLTGIASPVAATPEAATPQAAAPQTFDVAISQFTFNPATLEIHVGDTVTWTNNDMFPHDVAQLPKGSGFSSPTFGKGESYSVTFDTLGTYDYFCALHPIMLGTIVVVE